MSIDIKDLMEEISKIVNEAVKRETVRTASEQLRDDIKERTRGGEGVDKQGNKKPLKNLQSTTVQIRKNTHLHQSTSPERSNLTRKGKMLDSMVVVAKKREGSIQFKNKSQSRKAKAVTDLGFRFFKASKEETKRVVDYIQDVVDKSIAKFNNK